MGSLFQDLTVFALLADIVALDKRKLQEIDSGTFIILS